MTPDDFHAGMQEIQPSVQGLTSWMTAIEGMLAYLFAEASVGHNGREVKQFLSVDDTVETGEESTHLKDFNNCFRRVSLLLRYHYGIDVSQDHETPSDGF